MPGVLGRARARSHARSRARARAVPVITPGHAWACTGMHGRARARARAVPVPVPVPFPCSCPCPSSSGTYRTAEAGPGTRVGGYARARFGVPRGHPDSGNSWASPEGIPDTDRANRWLPRKLVSVRCFDSVCQVQTPCVDQVGLPILIYRRRAA